jgi:hypothetical protein
MRESDRRRRYPRNVAFISGLSTAVAEALAVKWLACAGSLYSVFPLHFNFINSLEVPTSSF